MGFGDLQESPPRLPRTGSVLRSPMGDGSIIFPASATPPAEKRIDDSKLIRASSLPPYIGKNGKTRETRLQRSIVVSVSASIGPTQGEESRFPNDKLVRAPSLPPDIGRKDAVQGGGESLSEPRRTRHQQNEGYRSTSATPPREKNHLPRTHLVRAPSLPPAMVIKKEEARGERSRRNPRTSRLERSMSSSFDNRPSSMPPGYRSYSSKRTKLPVVPQGRQPTKPNRQKSLNELEFEELQGFKDLGFTFNREDINPTILNVIPGLQENRPIDEERVSRPYLSEAWSVQGPIPPRLHWDHLSSRVDMKEQLKVWARTVATDVGQKC